MKKILVLLFVCCVILSSCFATSPCVAKAETVFSDVLDDLQNDSSFNSNDYPVNQTDYSLHLIQFGENSAKELIVYVYQPSAGNNNVVASKIRLRINGTYSDFNLTLLNSNSVFFKYKVENYTVSSEETRSYTPICLYRVPNVDCGDTLVDQNNNTINQISYDVHGWKYIIRDYNGSTYYGKEQAGYTVEYIYDKYVGQIRFQDDTLTALFSSMFDGIFYHDAMLHFVAFNTQYNVDDIRTVHGRYTLTNRVTTDYYRISGVTSNVDETSEGITFELSKDVVDKYQAGIFAHKYQWNQIMSKADFIQAFQTSGAFFNSYFTEAALSELDGKQWVYIFGLTENNIYTYSNDSVTSMTTSLNYVSDVSTLQLTVIRNGQILNLGVIDNYQSGDNIPDNVEEYGFNEEWVKTFLNDSLSTGKKYIEFLVIILGAILLLISLRYLIPILSFIFKIIAAPFKWLFGSNSSGRRKR